LLQWRRNAYNFGVTWVLMTSQKKIVSITLLQAMSPFDSLSSLDLIVICWANSAIILLFGVYTEEYNELDAFCSYYRRIELRRIKWVWAGNLDTGFLLVLYRVSRSNFSRYYQCVPCCRN
jgi:hypothetical protein